MSPWPQPEPGSSRPSTAGKISTLERKSAFDGGGGKNAPSTISYVDKRVVQGRPQCYVSMARETSRDSQRGKKLLYTGFDGADGRPPLDVTQTDPAKVLSTKHRPPSPVDFVRMRSRPPTPTAPERPPLPEAPLDPPRGFVDISRMTLNAERALASSGDPFAVAAATDDPREELHPNQDYVLRRAPTPIITRGEKPSAFGKGAAGGDAASPPRASSALGGVRSPAPAARGDLPPRPATVSPGRGRAGFGGGAADDSVFNPTIDATRRRAPSPSMRGTSRDAPVMRTKPSHDVTPTTVYDAKPVETHISSPSIRSGLSRSQRDKRYKEEKAVDALYDVPAPRVVGGALAFAKYKGRK
uniref:Uncharacterized protein n=1 Tax=Neobodo designis TaxID=312471 RepID=A0A7S1LMG8_NEODS|mmetsp:Transcript_24983/g.77204  ORF Transcript_24983/g.77204 Transcript_24983/m.77204 type:complete len:356 (+) Transcript_24983:2-1069(+)